MRKLYSIMSAQARWQQLTGRGLSWLPYDAADTQLCRVHKFVALLMSMEGKLACEQCRRQQSVSTEIVCKRIERSDAQKMYFYFNRFAQGHFFGVLPIVDSV